MRIFSAGFPVTKALTDLFRSDGKRPETHNARSLAKRQFWQFPLKKLFEKPYKQKNDRNKLN